MRALVACCGAPQTGSASTMSRIAQHLRACGHQVVYEWTADERPRLAELLSDRPVDVAFANHALLAGRLFRGSRLPHVIVLGGTDLNEDARDPRLAREMHFAARAASRLVVYNNDFKQRARALWPDCAAKVVRIPKGVCAHPGPFSIHGLPEFGSGDRIFLLPAGLRAVKDVLYLADTFEAWQREEPAVRLAIVGVPRELDYAMAVYRRCAASRALRVLDPLPQPALHAAMRDSEATLNTSRSECSPNSLLEAMHIGCPVAARDIPGIRDIVIDGVTGLRFNSPGQFVEQMRRLRDPKLRLRLTRQARQRVRVEHSLDAEQERYQALAADLATQ